MNARQTHLATLGLVRNPFPPTPDAGCYFSTPHLDEQMVELAHCIESRKGFCLLTAEVGMGKSTLVRRLMTDLSPKGVVSALVFNTFLQGPELLAAVLQDFGLESAGSMSADIAAFNAFLLSNHQEGKTCLLIIDDAQNLSESSLELVRLLCNLETDQEKLLQIMLAGQPELEGTLSRHNLRQLRSRVVKHARLHGLNSTEIADYVKFRFESAGSDGSLVLQADACQMLWQETQGVPRQIHLILDRCLYGLAAKEGNVIDPSLMRQAIDDSRVDLVDAAQVPALVPAPASGLRAPPLRWLAVAAVVLAVALIWSGYGSAGLQASLARAFGFAPQEQVAQMAREVHEGQEVAGVSAALASGAALPVAGARAPADGNEQAENPVSGQPVGGEVPPLDFAPGAGVAALPQAGPDGPACATHAQWPKGHMVVSQPVPALTQQLLGARLARLQDVCADMRQGQAWLTWGAPTSGYDTDKRLTAARFQIALTTYGSLLPHEVDGVWGDKSRRALKQFQTGIGLAPTGDIDAMSGLLLERFYVQEQ